MDAFTTGPMMCSVFVKSACSMRLLMSASERPRYVRSPSKATASGTILGYAKQSHTVRDRENIRKRSPASERSLLTCQENRLKGI